MTAKVRHLVSGWNVILASYKGIPDGHTKDSPQWDRIISFEKATEFLAILI